MKLGIIVRDMDINGGIQRTAIELARYAQDKGHEVTLYTYIHNPHRCFPEMSKGISIRTLVLIDQEQELQQSHVAKSGTSYFQQIIRWGTKQLRTLHRKASNYHKTRLYQCIYSGYTIAQTFRTIRMCQDEATQICDLVDPTTDVLNGIGGSITAPLAHFKQHYNANSITIWTCTDLPPAFRVGAHTPNEPRSKFNRICSDLPLQLWEKRMAKTVDQIIVHVSKNAQLIHDLLQRSSKTIYPGVDIQHFTFQPEHTRSSTPFLISTMAIFFRYRRFEDLVRAVALLYPKHDVQLEIAGSSRYEPDYAQELYQLAVDLGIGQVVTWRDWISEEELQNLYHRSNVFVWPNHNQSWGCAVFEAMASGTPVVVSQTAGASEVLTDGLNGTLIPPLEPSILANKLEQLILNPDLRSQLSESGQTLVQEMTWKQHAAFNLELFDELLRTSKTAH